MALEPVYRQRSQGDITPKITLPDELNEFYARFEAPNTGQQHKTLASEGILDMPLTMSSAELLTLGLAPSLCNWVLNFLTDRHQSVRVGNWTSGIRTLSTGTPQGCVLSPLLYILFTYDCVASQTNTKIIKFVDDTTVIGLITGGEEILQDGSSRRKRKEQHTPIYIGETEVERVKTFKFLGTYINKDFTWSHTTQQLLRRSQQRLYFLRRLKKV
ncbi:hypothetical protein QTP70_010671 [Hemibagrus guttatus]|uniref:Reverse transcriptase domain-containing protein n=1 Tax=Hemibagrus guttatus TaxID=175788 RepID=A0AAE0QBT8_9TELE|nr:hypothetical protein QTP70_010671 [Hemibagrus guttatus]